MHTLVSPECLGMHQTIDKRTTLPNVLFVGIQKGGTSAISKWLYDERGVCQSRSQENIETYSNKEVHYFDRHDNKFNFKEAKQKYGSSFSHCCSMTRINLGPYENVLAMDATPNYIDYPDRVKTAYDAADPSGRLSKNLKIIIILREPLSRELSYYNHIQFYTRRHIRKKKPLGNEWYLGKGLKSDGKSIRKFSEFVDEFTLTSLEKGKGHGLYHVKLREWFNLFDRQQILLLSHHELITNPERLLKRVESFLQLDDNIQNYTLKNPNSKPSTHKVSQMKCSDRDKMNQKFLPHNEALYTLLEENPGPEMEQRPFPKFILPDCLDS